MAPVPGFEARTSSRRPSLLPQAYPEFTNVPAFYLVRTDLFDPGLPLSMVSDAERAFWARPILLSLPCPSCDRSSMFWQPREGHDEFLCAFSQPCEMWTIWSSSLSVSHQNAGIHPPYSTEAGPLPMNEVGGRPPLVSPLGRFLVTFPAPHCTFLVREQRASA